MPDETGKVKTSGVLKKKQQHIERISSFKTISDDEMKILEKLYVIIQDQIGLVKRAGVFHPEYFEMLTQLLPLSKDSTVLSTKLSQLIKDVNEGNEHSEDTLLPLLEKVSIIRNSKQKEKLVTIIPHYAYFGTAYSYILEDQKTLIENLYYTHRLNKNSKNLDTIAEWNEDINILQQKFKTELRIYELHKQKGRLKVFEKREGALKKHSKKKIKEIPERVPKEAALQTELKLLGDLKKLLKAKRKNPEDSDLIRKIEEKETPLKRNLQLLDGLGLNISREYENIRTELKRRKGWNLDREWISERLKDAA